MTNHNQAIAWVIDANKALQASEKMRRLQAQQAKRVIGVVASAGGSAFVLKAVREETATEAQDVTII